MIRLSVAPHYPGWSVHRHGTFRAWRIFRSKRAAIAAAVRRGGERYTVFIHDKDGMVIDSRVNGPVGG